MGTWRRSGVVVESSSAPKLINTFLRPSRLFASDGITAKQLIHGDAIGADYTGATGQATAAVGDIFEMDAYCVGNETTMSISTIKNTSMGSWDLWVNGVQNRNWQAINVLGKFYNDDGGVFTDDTTDAGDAGYDDIIFLPAAEAINDATYFGWQTPFSGMVLYISQAAIGGTIAWEYWNGGAWAAVPGLVDASQGLTLDGNRWVTFTPPADWAANDPGAGATDTLFYIRLRVTAANITQQPTGHQVFIDGGYDDYAAAAGYNHRYISTTALAFNPGYNLVQIKGKDNNVSSSNHWISISGASIQ